MAVSYDANGQPVVQGQAVAPDGTIAGSESATAPEETFPSW